VSSAGGACISNEWRDGVQQLLCFAGGETLIRLLELNAQGYLNVNRSLDLLLRFYMRVQICTSLNAISPLNFIMKHFLDLYYYYN